MTTYHADICPICGYRLRIKEDVTMGKHYYKNIKTDGVCGGSYRVPIHRKLRKEFPTFQIYTEAAPANDIRPFLSVVSDTEVTLSGTFTKPNILERIRRIWKK